ncbi:2,4-dienoyl-CoA reductase [Sporobacter termitidis DSM 10068]|uniref:2,4-dienoyl-CoA reductase n=1 Tax=Sporobacter termitidis DSM 10068 TaxID=1123282 RepID=A0A1M5WWC2_9FIRM|nr:FAD-dependent oxidoreductase [Sporobacter termitidis]SHH91946.1 2,4-dienoyl-CoA reductase [Sporobacter termitidis DSM 10068]
MSDLKYPHLFEPIQVAGALFRNRLFSSPQGFYNLGPDLFPNDDMVAYFETKARGGFASVCVGDCIVDWKNGRHYDWLIPMDNPKMLPGLSKLASAVHRHGAVASAELSHAGMFAKASFDAGAPIKGPVNMAGKYGDVTAMTEEDIAHVVEAYGKAAAFAKQCGFGMVTIHGGHGWLIPQFWSGQINTRTDRWGGSFENRMRFPLAIVDSVRKAVGKGFPIEFRMSGSETNPDGYDIDEGIEFAKALDGKVDIIHVSTGNHEVLSATIITHPSMFLEDGCNVKYAAAIKKHVKTHVATVGAFTDPAHMEEVLASGQADIIELGRQTLADPDLPLKARAGRDDEINKCMRCSACFGNVGRHRIFYCAINPVVGHEDEARYLPPVREKKRVLVAGGGVAGMQAALTAAERGHSVTLCEKGGKLGGVLLCEDQISFKQKLKAYLEHQAHMLAKAPIEVRLNTEVTPEYARELRPDVIIAALGARPFVPPVKGIDGPNVLGAEEVYYHPERAGKRLVILGGGLVGIELGIHMAMLGRDVSIVEMLPELSVDNFSMHTLALLEQIGKLGIKVRTSTAVSEITPAGVTAKGPDGTLELPADTVVYAVGQKPLRDEAAALGGCAGEFYQLGDCVTPRNILAATQAAWTVARDIGR